jgi:hypothetical protein
MSRKRIKWILPVALLAAGVCASIVLVGGLSQAAAAVPPPPGVAKVNAAGDYVLLAWNDLGMHCYNRDFTDLAVLPPYNTLWAQVVRVGNPPQVITTGIAVTYVFTDNTYSVGKSNFWTYAKKLFGVDLPPNIGLAGKGLAGAMDLHGDHFEAVGIPLTEFRDSAPTTPYPFQLATITVRSAGTGAKLAESIVVAPVSTEMHCDYCHTDNGEGNEGIATGKVETNILTKHDREHMAEYPITYTGRLMDQRPVLCAKCHSSNALGAPGVPGIPSLSRAMHSKHADEVPSTLNGCYSCHPGPQTRCLRDVMSQRGMDCVSCHGPMSNVAQNPNPWLNEPRCDTCHNSGPFNQNQPLYRMSKEHGGIYCEACHDSTHAIAPSTQPNDAIKFIGLQGHTGTLDTCTVCHSSTLTGSGPHGIKAPIVRTFALEPNRAKAAKPGDHVVYTHTLLNTGNISDTYNLTWSTSRGWSTAVAGAGGATILLPGSVTLLPSQTALITVTVSVPTGAMTGTLDTTVVTATSPARAGRVVDVTLVPSSRIFMPIIMRP